MVYRHKDDCRVFPQNVPMEQMLDSLSQHKNVVSKKLGWEFVAQTMIFMPPAVVGGVGQLCWIISFRMPEDEHQPDIPIEQIAPNLG